MKLCNVPIVYWRIEFKRILGLMVFGLMRRGYEKN